MSFASRFVVIPLTLSVAFGARLDPMYDLIWRPRTADTLTFKMHVEIDSIPEHFIFTANIRSKVVKVKPNGDYDVETQTRDGHAIFGAHDEPIPDDNKATTDTYNSQGQKIASSEESDPVTDANPGFDTLDAVTDQLSPKDPQPIGGKWTALIKPNPKKKQGAARVDYILVGAEKQGAYKAIKIEYKYRETDKPLPIIAEGYILVNQDDFSLVRFEGTIKGATFSDDPDFPKGDATLSVIRD